MRLFWNIIMFVAFVQFGYGQNAHDTVFSNLSNGALLVRLQTKSETIKVLECQNQELANKLKAAQQRENDKVVEAFVNNFTICPVYFFYADNSKAIKQGNFENHLLDTSLMPIKSVPALNNNYLIAELKQAQGKLMPHEAKVNTYNEQGEVVATRDTVINFHSGYSIDALILLDNNFIPLSKPYPRYVRQNIAVRARNHAEMVQLLDAKIRKFLEKQH